MVHAEADAILNAFKEKADLQDSKIYVTLSPCNECAKMIVESGIKEVYYADTKDSDPFNAARKMFNITGVNISKI